MLLSIIVPVYNMAADGKLEFCLDSLVGQTLNKSEYEIIAVDDASTDNSLEILRRYENEYENLVKVVHYDVNKRQGGAKNAGLREASGEWIGFIDSDDWVIPEYYEKLIRRAADTGADMVGCDYNLVSEHTFKVGRVVSNNNASQTGILDDDKHRDLFMRPGSMVIKIYKHSIIKENHLDFPENIFYEDNCAGSIWSLYFKHFERVEEPMYFYYQHSVSTVHHISEQKCRDRMTAAQLLYNECRDRGFLEKYRDEAEYRFSELYYINTLFSYMSGVKHPQLSFIAEMRSGIKKIFPNFEKNKYYSEKVRKFEKKMISLNSKSSIAFVVYYKAKHFIWGLRSR